MSSTVFISYSHKDVRWKDRLAEQLGVFEQVGLVHTWHDGLIRPGSDWLPEIETAMAEAQVAVLLVTASFLTSDFIRKQEVVELLKRRQSSGLRVIPVFVKPCNWQVSQLGSIQGRPRDGKALSRLSTARADEELASIAAEIAARKAADGEPAIRRSDEEPVTLASIHQLPSPPRDFTGRVLELETLRHSAAADGAAGIFGIFGMGGVGKTALALKLAEELSGQYPDAQIYLDLQGTTTPLSVAEASAQVVRSFLPGARVPENEAGSAAAYQSMLYGKRALIFLDNAAGREQVEPLLPPRGCAVIVTSRFHIVLPGIAAMDLDELRPEDAQALLQSISSRIGSDAEELARVCGGLPLALRVAGRTLAERQDLVPAVYASRLAEGEGLGAVDGAFAASCGLLAPYLRRLWCLLSVFPSTFDGVAAAAVWELEESVSKDALGKLLTSSLIDWVAAVARYRLHDLARAYADRQLGGGEREAAGRRHAVYYLTVLGRADLLCRQMGEGALHGLRLLDAEWSNIEAGQAWAAAHPEANAGATGLCDAYSTAGAYGLALRQLPRQRVRWYEAALAAARWRKDRVAEAWYLGNLGIAYGDLGERRHAIELHEQCLAIARETGDLNTVGSALMNLGLTYADLEENRRAIEFYEQRLVLAREAGDHRAEGDTVNNMGLAYAALGENGRAIELYENRLAMARETGDQRGMIATLNNMGLAYAAVGENDRAIKLYEESLAKARETGDRGGESDALNNMGVAYAARGEYRQAVERYEKRLAIAREYSDWLGESSTLGNLGLAYTELGETGRAIECYGEQLAIARKTEDRWSEGWASWNLGLIFEGQGDLVRAVKLMQVLVDLERETGHADAEGDAAQVEEVRARLVAEGRHPTGSS